MPAPAPYREPKFGFDLAAAIARLRDDLTDYLRDCPEAVAKGGTDETEPLLVALRALTYAAHGSRAYRKAFALMQLAFVQGRVEGPWGEFAKYATLRAQASDALARLLEVVNEAALSWCLQQVEIATKAEAAANAAVREEDRRELAALADAVTAHLRLTTEHALTHAEPPLFSWLSPWRHTFEQHLVHCVWPARLALSISTTLGGLKVLDPSNLHQTEELHFSGTKGTRTRDAVIVTLRGGPEVPSGESLTFRQIAALVFGDDGAEEEARARGADERYRAEAERERVEAERAEA